MANRPMKMLQPWPTKNNVISPNHLICMMDDSVHQHKNTRTRKTLPIDLRLNEGDEVLINNECVNPDHDDHRHHHHKYEEKNNRLSNSSGVLDGAFPS